MGPLTGAEANMLLIVLIACGVALLTCHGINVSIKGFQLRLSPSKGRHTTVVQWGITIACSIVAILAISSFCVFLSTDPVLCNARTSQRRGLLQ